MKIYHNPRCSKSRQTLQIINDNGSSAQIIEYLKHPPTVEELTELIEKLDILPYNLLRRGEKIFKDQYKGKSFSDEEWIGIMCDNPVLIERPIVVKGNKAVLGRPPENVLELL